MSTFTKHPTPSRLKDTLSTPAMNDASRRQRGRLDAPPAPHPSIPGSPLTSRTSREPPYTPSPPTTAHTNSIAPSMRPLSPTRTGANGDASSCRPALRARPTSGASSSFRLLGVEEDTDALGGVWRLRNGAFSCFPSSPPLDACTLSPAPQRTGRRSSVSRTCYTNPLYTDLHLPGSPTTQAKCPAGATEPGHGITSHRSRLRPYNPGCAPSEAPIWSPRPPHPAHLQPGTIFFNFLLPFIDAFPASWAYSVPSPMYIR